jgi:hypothetical protein
VWQTLAADPTIACSAGGLQVAKVVECNKINNVADCTVVIRADTEPEVINLMQEHTKTHGLPPNPQLAIKIKARIRDE